MHTDPWEGEWFRFDSFRPDQASPHGLGFKRYTLVAQNESHDRIRNAQFVVCYQRPVSTEANTNARVKAEDAGGMGRVWTAGCEPRLALPQQPARLGNYRKFVARR